MEPESRSVTSGFSLTPTKPVFQPGESPSTIGEAYRPISKQDGPQQTYMDIIADQKRVEEVSVVRGKIL